MPMSLIEGKAAEHTLSLEILLFPRGRDSGKLHSSISRDGRESQVPRSPFQFSSFIAKDSTVYANRFIKILISKTNILKKYSYSGRMLPELQDETISEII